MVESPRVTITGARRWVVVPSPRMPLPFCPQHSTPPVTPLAESLEMAQLPAMIDEIVWPFDVSDFATGFWPATVTSLAYGCWVLVAPFPCWPSLLYPK